MAGCYLIQITELSLNVSTNHLDKVLNLISIIFNK